VLCETAMVNLKEQPQMSDTDQKLKAFVDAISCVHKIRDKVPFYSLKHPVQKESSLFARKAEEVAPTASASVVGLLSLTHAKQPDLYHTAGSKIVINIYQRIDRPSTSTK